jgi:hypothetical protein
MELFGKRNQVNRLLRFPERDHLRENAAVLIEEKILGAQAFNRGVQRVVVEQNRAQHGTLGVEVAGEGFFQCGIRRHRTSYFFAFSSLYVSRRAFNDKSTDFILFTT